MPSDLDDADRRGAHHHAAQYRRPVDQATRLTSALDRDGFTTTLIHGRLGDGEGDMSYLIAPGSRAIYVDTLRRPLSPLDDLRALRRLIGELKPRGRRSCTRTWPRPACSAASPPRSTT